MLIFDGARVHFNQPMIHWMIQDNIPGHIKTGKSVFSKSQTHSNTKNKTTVQATVQATRDEINQFIISSCHGEWNTQKRTYFEFWLEKYSKTRKTISKNGLWRDWFVDGGPTREFAL